MSTLDNQLTQPKFTSYAGNQPAEGGRRFSLSRRRLILILVGSFFLVFIFGLGARAGEKRALRKQPQLQTQLTPRSPGSTIVPTPIPNSPSPTKNPNLPMQNLPMQNLPTPMPCTKDSDCTYTTSGEICLDPTFKGCIPCLPPYCFEEEPQTVKGQCINSTCVYSNATPKKEGVTQMEFTEPQ